MVSAQLPRYGCPLDTVNTTAMNSHILISCVKILGNLPFRKCITERVVSWFATVILGLDILAGEVYPLLTNFGLGELATKMTTLRDWEADQLLALSAALTWVSKKKCECKDQLPKSCQNALDLLMSRLLEYLVKFKFIYDRLVEGSALSNDEIMNIFGDLSDASRYVSRYYTC